jgi:cell volume regulation protein A
LRFAATEAIQTMDTGSSHDVANGLLRTFGIVLAGGTLGGVLAKFIKVPDVAIFLLVGMALGPHVFGVIHIGASSTLNQVVLIFGACYILFDGGSTLRLAVLREVWLTVVVISTVGVLITAAVTAIAARWLIGLPIVVAALLGSALAATDPATLVPIFKQVNVRARVAQTVISESAFNDAVGAIITYAALAFALGHGETSVSSSLLDLLQQAGVGIAVGAVVGGLTAVLLAHERYAFLGEFSAIVTLMAVAGAYLSADKWHASGFMAVFVFGLLLGNTTSFGLQMNETQRAKMSHFVDETALIMRLVIFVLLGSQVNLVLVRQHWPAGVAVVLIFMFVARPLTVFICTWPDRRARWSLREKLFMCWTRETGVIPAALAGLLVGLKAPGAEIIAAVTLIAILMTILIQAPTTRWLAGRLGVLDEPS